jgi:hypothetical protein
MSRTIPLIGLLLALALLAGPARSVQESQSSSPSQNPPASTSPSSQDSAHSAAKKPKKVWTNENLSETTGIISVVGNPPPPPPRNSAAARRSAAAPAVDDRQLATIREQLQKLDAQLAIIDKQLTDLKDFNKGEQKGSGDLRQNTWNYNSSSIDEQIRILQRKRDQFQAAIDALLDDARKKGIEPGQLR